ncbi:hypothetical protein T4B_9902 [Trichinella pseudospiralis]|uniref:Uncharacterized protein n=1 Tax=Trichinella pseudospiralis TaxID=6337 RepID=A0A0V1GDY4_TRIPS|nr:hypothetical protein T4B_9902 [Trichinella pseudospiralis]
MDKMACCVLSWAMKSLKAIYSRTTASFGVKFSKTP